MNPTTQVRRLLDAHDFSLVRQRKHEVYRSPHGITFVRPHTGSDSRRGDWNSLADLKRLLRQNGVPIEVRESEAAAIQERISTETVQVAKPAPVTNPTPAPEAKSAPPPLTKAEQKKLARWEKNYAAKKREQESFLARVCDMAACCAELFRFGVEESVVASAALQAARKGGLQAHLLLVDTQARKHDDGTTKTRKIVLVEVNGYHFDPRCAAVWRPGKAFAGPHKFQDCTIQFLKWQEIR